MFQAKTQEYHDAHTGVTLAFGEHANGGSWVRITVPGTTSPIVNPSTRSSTVYLRHGEIVRSDAHPLVGPDAGGDTPDDPDAKTIVPTVEEDEGGDGQSEDAHAHSKRKHKKA